MNKFCISILLVIFFGLSSSCNFISNTLKYRETTKEFTEHMLQKNYDKCVGLMAMDHPTAAGTNIDTIKAVLDNLRNILVSNFGDELDYTLMSAVKKWSTNENESTPPNTTRVEIQISNNTEFGVLQMLFDDKSKKILSFKILEIKQRIPGMVGFWLFGLLAICIPVFNIYMIVKVKRSQLKKKWLAYLAIIILNVPSFTYNAITGLSLQVLSFQILFGLSFEYLGYMNSAWTFGIPLGGLLVLWKLSSQRNHENQSLLTEESDPDLAKSDETY